MLLYYTAYINLSLVNAYYFLLPNIGLFIDKEFILLERKVHAQMSGFNGLLIQALNL